MKLQKSFIMNNDEFDTSNGDWRQYRLVVLRDLKELKESVSDIQEKMNKMREEITLLNFKAALYGGGTALIVSVIAGVAARGWFG